MCELYGFTSQSPQDISPSLKSFYSHSTDHPDGWGLALLRGSEVNIEKEPTPAFDSQYLLHRLSVPIRETLVLAHIRKASVGRIRYDNCHPFTGKDKFGTRWVLTHNGTLFEEPDRETYSHQQNGSTDSERLLLRFLEQVDGCTAQPRASQCAGFLGTIAGNLTIGNNKINMMLSDGTNLFVYANHCEKLWMCMKDGAVTFATVPPDDSDWEKVPELRVITCQAGKIMDIGDCRGIPYIPPAEQK